MFTVGWFFTAAVNIPVGVNIATTLGLSTWSLNIEIAPLDPRLRSAIEAGSEIATTTTWMMRRWIGELHFLQQLANNEVTGLELVSPAY